ncbi:serine hydrolase domain-containing protein [Chryseobacterium sp.]|uniref:serine hydrolase domain-containing protein n=1 Tax=Chryseobacterium sp. TaxID=1871047 RepID=UPI00389083AB
MQKFKSVFLLFLIYLFPISCTFGQKNASLSPKIDSLVASKDPTFFNGVISITKDNKSIYRKAVGFRNLETKDKTLQLSDRFEIMSLSKQVCSVLILNEVEKSKINLNATIKTYLPNLSRSWADTVTVHQLLNHTHGIESLDKPLSFKPGTDFKYGNLSNVLLQQILEKVTHETYRQLAEQLFEKNGLKNTYCYQSGNNKDLVAAHLVDENTIKIPSKTLINEGNLAADGIVTNAEDLLFWNDKLHSGKILSKKMYQLMIKSSAQSQHDVFGKAKQGYGYNIRNIVENKINYIGHTGLGDGFSALSIYFPKSKVNVVILQNVMIENSKLYYYYETAIKNMILQSELID